MLSWRRKRMPSPQNQLPRIESEATDERNKHVTKCRAECEFELRKRAGSDGALSGVRIMNASEAA
jgi:hypothetical protein